MKKLLTKALGVALSLAVAVSFLTPTTTLAADKIQAPKNVTLYRTAKDDSSWGYFTVSGLTKSQKIKTSTVKSSKKAIAKVDYLQRFSSTYNVSHEYIDSSMKDYNMNYGYADYSYNIGLELKKAGKSTISYKVGNDTYKTKVTVKNYENPLKTLKITGISKGKNVASKLKTQSSAEFKLTKNTSDALLTLAANKNWKVTSVDVYYIGTKDTSYATEEQISYYSSSKGRSSLKINLGDLSKKGIYEFHIQMTNTKDGGMIDCHFYINYHLVN